MGSGLGSGGGGCVGFFFSPLRCSSAAVTKASRAGVSHAQRVREFRSLSDRDAAHRAVSRKLVAKKKKNCFSHHSLSPERKLSRRRPPWPPRCVD